MAARLETTLWATLAALLLAVSVAGAVHPDSAWDTAIGFPGAFSPNWSSGYDEEINALLEADLDGLPGTEIYAGGVFESIGQEQPATELHFGIARWDGIQWHRLLHGLDRYEGPFDEQLARVKDMALFDDGSGEALYVTGWDAGSGLMDISYRPACDAADHTVYVGDLSGVSSCAWTGAACGLGVSGTATFEPGAGSVFFVIVGHDGAAEGSYGRDSTGSERPEDVGTAGCDLPQDLLGNVCM